LNLGNKLKVLSIKFLFFRLWIGFAYYCPAIVTYHVLISLITFLNCYQILMKTSWWLPCSSLVAPSYPERNQSV